jgi:hypothetical protein
MVRDSATGDWIGTFTGHKEPSGLAAWTSRQSRCHRQWRFQCPRLGMVLPANRSISFLQNILSRRVTFRPIRDIVRVDNEGILRVFDC